MSDNGLKYDWTEAKVIIPDGKGGRTEITLGAGARLAFIPGPTSVRVVHHVPLSDLVEPVEMEVFEVPSDE